uniref:hypothetical protein n=1 Tax=Polyopes affinis TaxID=194519 RepID=UPI002A809A40|nr:hypothetical protein NDC12_pgp058 [Polyopes affinis]WOL37078.1 hypothetical protein [Polyopes affinis]
MSNQSAYIIEINSKINLEILNYLYSNCIIVGTKTLFNEYKVAIIELNDYTRIWMLPEEINIIKQ